jgi:hypothetical protein
VSLTGSNISVPTHASACADENPISRGKCVKLTVPTHASACADEKPSSVGLARWARSRPCICTRCSGPSFTSPRAAEGDRICPLQSCADPAIAPQVQRLWTQKRRGTRSNANCRQGFSRSAADSNEVLPTTGFALPACFFVPSRRAT